MLSNDMGFIENPLDRLDDNNENARDMYNNSVDNLGSSNRA